MQQFTIPSDGERLAGLRRQHLALERTGYDGHNRRSGLLTMHRHALRRRRRTWNRRLRTWCSTLASLPGATTRSFLATLDEPMQPASRWE